MAPPLFYFEPRSFSAIVIQVLFSSWCWGSSRGRVGDGFSMCLIMVRHLVSVLLTVACLFLWPRQLSTALPHLHLHLSILKRPSDDVLKPVKQLSITPSIRGLKCRNSSMDLSLLGQPLLKLKITDDSTFNEWRVPEPLISTIIQLGIRHLKTLTMNNGRRSVRIVKFEQGMLQLRATRCCGENGMEGTQIETSQASTSQTASRHHP